MSKQETVAAKFCENPECGERIDPVKIVQAGRKGLRFCSRACAVVVLKKNRFYHRMGQLGQAAQAEYKRKHGKMPGPQRGGPRFGKGPRGPKPRKETTS